MNAALHSGDLNFSWGASRPASWPARHPTPRRAHSACRRRSCRAFLGLSTGRAAAAVGGVVPGDRSIRPYHSLAQSCAKPRVRRARARRALARHRRAGGAWVVPQRRAARRVRPVQDSCEAAAWCGRGRPALHVVAACSRRSGRPHRRWTWSWRATRRRRIVSVPRRRPLGVHARGSAPGWGGGLLPWLVADVRAPRPHVYPRHDDFRAVEAPHGSGLF